MKYQTFALVTLIALTGAGCSNISPSISSKDTKPSLSTCRPDTYQSAENLQNDSLCSSFVDEFIGKKCKLDTYNSREEIQEKYSTPECQDILSFQSSRDSKEAELKGVGLETLLRTRLSSIVNNNSEFITHTEAVKKAKESKAIESLSNSFPGFLDNVSIYTTREAKKLSESSLLFPITRSIEAYDQENLNEDVWHVLFTCRKLECDRVQFLYALNVVLPPVVGEGVEFIYDDLVFVIHADTGEVIMYERGPGLRGDALAFESEWLEFVQ